MAGAPQESGLPDTQIVLAGQTFTLRFGLRAILALKRKWGLANQREVQAYIATNTEDLEVMVDVVWASLQAHHRDLSAEDVLDLIDGGDLAEISASLSEAMASASPPGSDSPP